jgi:hypothetical protein
VAFFTKKIEIFDKKLRNYSNKDKIMTSGQFKFSRRFFYIYSGWRSREILKKMCQILRNFRQLFEFGRNFAKNFDKFSEMWQNMEKF